MIVAVVSIVHAGHVPAYHRHYVEAFRAAGCEVLDLGAPAAGTNSPGAEAPRSAWRAWLGRVLETSAAGRTWKARRRARRVWTGAADRVRRALGTKAGEPLVVFFPYLDIGFLAAAAAPESVPAWLPWRWAGVVTGPRAVRLAAGTFPDNEAPLAAANCAAAVVTDDAFVAPCAQAWPGRKVIVMPEIADLTAPASSADLADLLAWKGDRRLVGLLGVISAKKNVAAFVASARRAAAERRDLAFVLAGDFSAQACPAAEHQVLQEILADLPSNCRLYPAPIPDGAKFNAWVEACDVLWLAYHDVAYKSNVLTKAAHFRRPVLASPGRVMAEHVARFQLGEIIDAARPAEVLAAIDRVRDDPPGGRHYAAFAERNGRPRLAETVQLLLAAFRE